MIEALLIFLRDNASVIIALCALYLTLKQLGISREHNKMSVRPHLITTTESDDKEGVYKVILKNNGIGPAQFNKVSLFLDNKLFELNGERKIKDMLSKMFNKHHYSSRQTDLGDNYVMSPNEEIMLLEFKLIEPESERKNAIDIFNRADISIEYNSFYGDSFIFDTKENSNKPLNQDAP